MSHYRFARATVDPKTGKEEPAVALGSTTDLDQKLRSNLPSKIVARILARAQKSSAVSFSSRQSLYGPSVGGSFHGDDLRSGPATNVGGLLLKSFLLVVVIPTLVAFLYYAFLASRSYVSEAKLIVRTAPASEGGSSALSDAAGSFIGKLGLAKGGATNEDSHIILDYIGSRAAIADVGGPKKLAEYFSRPEIDWFSRMDQADYAEEIWSYWKWRVSATVDSISNILTLRVRAYSPEDALALANQLVSSSEKLINDISHRSRQDALDRAQEEITRSMAELAKARLDLLEFQQSNRLIDPVQSAKQVTTLIATLTSQKIALESELAVADATGVKGRPGDRYLQTRLEVINSQINELEKLLTGKGKSSVSLQLKDFELLKLREEFAQRMYVLSRSSYEEARRNVEKQQLYLSIIVPPQLPERALYPKVITDSAFVFLAFFVFWAISSLFVASIKDSTEL